MPPERRKNILGGLRGGKTGGPLQNGFLNTTLVKKGRKGNDCRSMLEGKGDCQEMGPYSKTSNILKGLHAEGEWVQRKKKQKMC